MHFETALHATIGLFMFSLLTSCSPAAPLNFLARSDAWTVSTEKYGPESRNGLDIYVPNGRAHAPVIVFFYGGSWQGGDKETYRFVGANLAARGYVAVIPDYRVYPEVGFSGFMEDGAQSVAWVKRNIREFGGDADRVVLLGHSAGAHIAALLTLDGSWLAKAGLNSRRDIAGLIGMAGPYDFLPLKDETLKAIFAGGNLARTQPISFVTGGEPPVLLMTARQDSTVNPGNTSRLAARLRIKGDDVTEIDYSAVGHLTLVAAFAPALRLLAPVGNDIDAFMREHVVHQRRRTASGAVL